MNMITYFNELVTKNFNNYLKKYLFSTKFFTLTKFFNIEKSL